MPMVAPVLPHMKGKGKDGKVDVRKDNCLNQGWLKYFAYTNFTKLTTT